MFDQESQLAHERAQKYQLEGGPQPPAATLNATGTTLDKFFPRAASEAQ